MFHEQLSVDGNPVFVRELAQVRLARIGTGRESNFSLDWHTVALPIVQSPESTTDDQISIFRQWLAAM